MDTGQDNAWLKFSKFFQIIWHENTSNWIHLHLCGSWQEESIEASCIRLPEWEFTDFRSDFLPLQERIYEETVIKSSCDDKRTPKLLTPFTGQGQPLFRIQRMLVFAN